jgi:hypothetical protein
MGTGGVGEAEGRSFCSPGVGWIDSLLTVGKGERGGTGDGLGVGSTAGIVFGVDEGNGEVDAVFSGLTGTVASGGREVGRV